MQSGQVALHRAYSSDAAPLIDDGSLDWVYLDGLHSEAGVAADLRDATARRSSPTASCSGTTTPTTARPSSRALAWWRPSTPFARVRAGTSWVLTMENFPTYVLVRDPASPTAQILLASVLYHSAGAVELSGYPRGYATYQHKAIVVGDKTLSHPTFSPRPDCPPSATSRCPANRLPVQRGRFALGRGSARRKAHWREPVGFPETAPPSREPGCCLRTA